MTDWSDRYVEAPRHLEPSEFRRWLWEIMDSAIDLLVTHQGIEIIAAFRRSAGRCGICGEAVDLAIVAGPKQPSIDHIVPVSRGVAMNAATFSWLTAVATVEGNRISGAAADRCEPAMNGDEADR